MTIEKFNLCVDSLTKNLYCFILKTVGGDSQSADDIVQESFTRLWERRDSVNEGSEKSFLFTVAYHLAIDHIRHIKHIDPIDLERLQKPSPPQINSYTGVADMLQQALEELPTIYQQVITLRHVEDLSYQQITDITGLSLSQVKVYIFRARTELKKRLGNLNELM